MLTSLSFGLTTIQLTKGTVVTANGGGSAGGREFQLIRHRERATLGVQCSGMPTRPEARPRPLPDRNNSGGIYRGEEREDGSRPFSSCC